jgi:formamidopyrimidine-DNA glycosylase
MPELPEVETIRRGLHAKILNKKIVKIEALEKKMFIGDAKKILNQKIVDVARRAKVLKIIFENGYCLLVHFKLNGQLILNSKPQLKIQNSECEDIIYRFTRVILHLNDDSTLLFNDSRKFGWMKVVKLSDLKEKFGIEPLTPDFTLANFTKVLAKSGKPIKILLMDQEKIAGLGNIYVTEALYAAKVNPFKKAKDMTEKEVKNLFFSIVRIIETAVKYKGSSGKDEWYRQVDGSIGHYQEHFLVYQKEKEKCRVCGGIIKREKQGGRSTYYCPKCQK